MCVCLFRFARRAQPNSYASLRSKRHSGLPSRSLTLWWFLYFFAAFCLAAGASRATGWATSATEAALLAAAVTLSSTERVRGGLERSMALKLSVCTATEVYVVALTLP